jgi:hypothetical protein
MELSQTLADVIGRTTSVYGTTSKYVKSCLRILGRVLSCRSFDDAAGLPKMHGQAIIFAASTRLTWGSHPFRTCTTRTATTTDTGKG